MREFKPLPFAWRDAVLELKGVKLSVWLACYWWSNFKDEHDLTLGQLAEITGHSEKHIKRARSFLRKHGYLKTVRRRASRGEHSVPVELAGVNLSSTYVEPTLNDGSTAVQPAFEETKCPPLKGQKVPPTGDKMSLHGAGQNVTGEGETKSPSSVHVRAVDGDVAADDRHVHARSAVIADADSVSLSEGQETLRSELGCSESEALVIGGMIGEADPAEFIAWVKKVPFWRKQVWENAHGDAPAAALRFSLGSKSDKNVLSQYVRWRSKQQKHSITCDCGATFQNEGGEFDRHAESCAVLKANSTHSYLEGKVTLEDA